MIDLTVWRYVEVAAVCFLAGLGVEYRRQLWLRTRSPWEICRICLALATMVAVVAAMPLGGIRAAMEAGIVAGLLNLLISVLEHSGEDESDGNATAQSTDAPEGEGGEAPPSTPSTVSSP